MSSALLPSPSTITALQFTNLLSLYPLALERAYKLNPRLKDPKKLADALADDAWRYDELPRIVAERRDEAGLGRRTGAAGEGVDGACLEKGELERLVRWKITHGQYRPFLPSQIRQNEPSLIKSTTQAAFSNLGTHTPTTHTKSSSPYSYPHIQSVLTSLTNPLKGVGPATGTLLLSIGDPPYIPFFSDELYGWLIHHDASKATTGIKEEKLKLKYDVKEYERLYVAWVEFRERLVLLGAKEKKMGALQVEQLAFVLGRWGVLDKQERVRVMAMGKTSEDGDLETHLQEERESSRFADGQERANLDENVAGDDRGDVAEAEKGEQLLQGVVVGEKKKKKDGRKEGARGAARGRKAKLEEDGEMDVRLSKRLKR